MTYRAALTKRKWEHVAVAPFIWLGKLAGALFPLKSKHKLILFFPNADIGGAPRVNLDVTMLAQHDQPLIIFSKKAHNDLYRQRYEASGAKILDLHRYVDNKLFHFVNFFFRGLLAAWINQQPYAVVFGGESIYFYKVIPHIRKNIRCVELTHVDVWLPFTIGFIDRVDARVFSTRRGMKKVEEQYAQNNLPAHYYERLFFVDNAVDLPEIKPTHNSVLQVFFIGRGATQKRIHLVAAIAGKMYQKNLPVHFNFVGDVDKIIDPATLPFCSFYGTVTDENAMHDIYQKADVLILTSAFEGLPVVVMQMMAYGKVVVSTAVSGIPDYIIHRQNGILLNATNENEIVEQAVAELEWLLNSPAERQQLGMAARKDAERLFSREAFNREYRRLLCI
ncbi:MAG: glycosyltransferase [Chitinophagaceae bacterium]|nr:MAG: glycosyltransferase [Chitinophagaceae bacterium]